MVGKEYRALIRDDSTNRNTTQNEMIKALSQGHLTYPSKAIFRLIITLHTFIA